MTNESNRQTAHESKYSDQNFVLRKKSPFCLQLIEKHFTETISLLKNFGVGKVRRWQTSKGKKSRVVSSGTTGYPYFKN